MAMAKRGPKPGVLEAATMGENIFRYSEILPPLSSDEFAALQVSIRREGVREAIVVDEDGNILDGRHRYQIDPKCKRKVLTGLSEAEKRAFVFRRNVAERRNLSPDQRREAHAKMRKVAAELKSEGKTGPKIGELLGVDQSTVSRWVEKRNNMQLHNVSPIDCRVKLRL